MAKTLREKIEGYQAKMADKHGPILAGKTGPIGYAEAFALVDAIEDLQTKVDKLEKKLAAK